MPKNNNPLLNSLNLLFFLLIANQNPDLFSNNTQNVDSLLESKTNLKQKENSRKIKDDFQKEKLKEHNFWNELYIHAKKVNYLQIKIMGNGPESNITGYLGKLYNDFITLVEKGEKINIPINKILTLKLVDSDKSNLNKNLADKINKSNEQFTGEKRHTPKIKQLQLPLGKLDISAN